MHVMTLACFYAVMSLLYQIIQYRKPSTFLLLVVVLYLYGYALYGFRTCIYAYVYGEHRAPGIDSMNSW